MSQPIHLPFLSDLIIFSLLISTPSLPFQKLEVKSVVKSDVKWSLLWLGSLNSNSLGPLMAPVTSRPTSWTTLRALVPIPRPAPQPYGGSWSALDPNSLSDVAHEAPPCAQDLAGPTQACSAPKRLWNLQFASLFQGSPGSPRLGVPPPPSFGREQPTAGWWSHTRDLGVGVPPTSAPEGHSQIILMA